MTHIIWEGRRGRAGRITPWSGMPSLWLSLAFEPRDLRVGLHWTRPDVNWKHALDIYVCLLPCLVVKLSPRWGGWAVVRRDFSTWLYERHGD